MADNARVTGWIGWIWFAGMIMIMAGLFNVLTGLLAIIDDDLYVPAAGRLLAFDISGWGWIHLLLGIVLTVTGVALSLGQGWARVAGVVLVMLNAVTQMAWIGVNPWWSLIVIALDVVVIYAIVVHGGEARALSD
ncbi:membrane protein [Nonomuraea africana]|uniref:Vacuolar-type H+-ATPase subunit I/STV1 n=1 Tax=Nonomuraea africana TaxID=46171 RepID=A0ABR9KRP8_9ACTN|nr:hypothetical protein [Nonomuraea africana]MBE1564416.1 vacuolar-type H+-ATPase subunit I/STV1 [Nonomuraea africana]